MSNTNYGSPCYIISSPLLLSALSVAPPVYACPPLQAWDDQASHPYRTWRLIFRFQYSRHEEKYSELNDDKHFLNLICSQFHNENSFHLLISKHLNFATFEQMANPIQEPRVFIPVCRSWTCYAIHKCGSTVPEHALKMCTAGLKKRLL